MVVDWKRFLLVVGLGAAAEAVQYFQAVHLSPLASAAIGMLAVLVAGARKSFLGAAVVGLAVCFAPALVACQAPQPQTVVDVAALGAGDLACVMSEWELGDKDPMTVVKRCHLASSAIDIVQQILTAQTQGHNLAMAEMGAVDSGPGK